MAGDGSSRILRRSAEDFFVPFLSRKKVPPPTPERHEGRLFPPEQANLITVQELRKPSVCRKSKGRTGAQKRQVSNSLY
jgi:hypothetical protein